MIDVLLKSPSSSFQLQGNTRLTANRAGKDFSEALAAATSSAEPAPAAGQVLSREAATMDFGTRAKPGLESTQVPCPATAIDQPEEQPCGFEVPGVEGTGHPAMGVVPLLPSGPENQESGSAIVDLEAPGDSNQGQTTENDAAAGNLRRGTTPVASSPGVTDLPPPVAPILIASRGDERVVPGSSSPYGNAWPVDLPLHAEPASGKNPSTKPSLANVRGSNGQSLSSASVPLPLPPGPAIDGERASGSLSMAVTGITHLQLEKASATTASVVTDSIQGPAMHAIEVREPEGEQGRGAVSGSDFPSPQVGGVLHLRAQAGQDSHEWIIHPWRLRAASGLSYRGNQSNEEWLAGSPHAAVVAARPPLLPASMAGAGWLEDKSGTVPSGIAARVPMRIEAPPGSADEILDAESPAALAGGRSMAAWVHWPQRMLRWRTDATGDGHVTAWIRDFSLETDDIHPLVDSLRALSQEQGFSLRRVMVNGHEAWTADEHFHPTGRGDDGR